MRLLSCVGALALGGTLGLAAAHSWSPCGAGGPQADHGTVIQAVNPGLNRVSLAVCSALDNSTCAQPGVAAPCTSLAPLEANSSQYINITANATSLVFWYHTPWAFHWHRIESVAPFVAPFYPAAGGNPLYIVPYPSANAMLCDVDEDCAAGLTCVLKGSSHVCTGIPPSPRPQPIPPPIPSPSPRPAAASCNLTGTFRQAYIHPSGGWAHGPSAIINVTMTGATSFVFNCESKDGYCPAATTQCNGTGALASSGGAVTLRLTNGTEVVGEVNDTLTCTPLIFNDKAQPGIPLVWDASVNVGAQLNLDVSLATFMGGSSGRGVAGTPFSGSGVVVLGVSSDRKTATVAVAGNGAGSFGETPMLLLGANSSANATVVVMDVGLVTQGGTAPSVRAVVKLGDRIDHMRTSGKGRIAVVGSFGVASLDVSPGGPTSASSAFRLAWNDSLADVEAGSCGVCCSSNGRHGSANCVVDIGQDGTVAAFLAAQGSVRGAGSGWLLGVWSGSGQRVGVVARSASSITSVAVDAARQRVLVGSFYDSNTGHEPMVMPEIAFLSYAGAKGDEPLQEAFRDFPWSAKVYREPGPCNGHVADARIEGIRFGQDGTLVLAGRSDGGDSPWHCGLRDVQRSVPFVAVDAYTSAFNMQAQAITNLILADADSGEARAGQVMLGRLSNTAGNTMVTRAASTDKAGVVYGLQDAACCLPEMANLTVNGHTLAPPSDSSALVVVGPRLLRRPHWTHFSTPEQHGSESPVDIDVRDGAVALLSTSEGSMVAVNSLDGSGPPRPGKDGAFAYLVVLPEVVIDA